MKLSKEQVLKKHVGMIHCEGRLSLIQRKISNILIFNAYNAINTQEIFEISLKNLCAMIGYKSNDINLIKQALKQLISLVIEWNVLKKDKDYEEYIEVMDSETNPDLIWHASSLLAGVSIENGIVKYSYSPQIKKIIASLDIYGQINLFVQSKLKSSYSLALYENCVRFKKIKQTCWFDLETIRTLLGIEKDKYKEFKYLARSVVQPAIKEINNKSDISIEVQFKKVGKNVVSMKFLMEDNTQYLPKLRRKEKDLPTHKQDLQKLLINTFKFKEIEALKVVEEYDVRYVREKLDLLIKTSAYKDNKINDINLYFKTLLGEAKNKDDNKSTRIPDQSKEEIKVAFYKEYTEYKITMILEFMKSLDKDIKKEILNSYERYLNANNTILLKSFKKFGLNSPLTTAEFLKFMEDSHKDIVPRFMAYEDFITENRVSVHKNNTEMLA